MSERKKVLCVEDNAVNMILVERIVEAEGHELIKAEDGYTALDILANTVPDIILLDINLPGIDGLELARRFKADERLAPIPLVATTAQVLVGDRERCLAAGMNDYLSKPFTLEGLREVLGPWLDEEITAEKTVPEKRLAESSKASMSSGIDDKVIAGIRALQQSGQPNLLAKVVRLFLAQSVKDFSGLHLAIDQHDRDGVQSFAHKLKSACANLGGMQMATALREIELGMREGRPLPSQEEYEGLEKLFNRFRADLEHLLEQEVNDDEKRHAIG